MLNAIITFSEKKGFIRNVLSVVHLKQFRIGPVGNLLLQNLKKEWFNSIIINNEISMFLNEDLSTTFLFAKEFCYNNLPFGIAQELPLHNIDEQKGSNTSVTTTDLDFDNFLLNKDKMYLYSTLFFPANDSLPFFHKWQKQRRMWWRKFSPNPGRYELTDIRIDNNNVQSVDIVAKYAWGNQIVEKLFISPFCDCIDKEQLQFKEKNTIIEAYKVVSKVSLNTLFLNTICDAYEDSQYKGNTRTFFRFHRKLSPYSISFAVNASSRESKDELYDLAIYLTKKLRGNNISTLLLPSSSTSLTLKNLFIKFDELGIPYNVELNENTLKNGIMFLRSRDTTLKEEIHVSELNSYVDQLFKNY